MVSLKELRRSTAQGHRGRRVVTPRTVMLKLSLRGLWSELVEYFRAQMRKDPDMASAVAAIRTLLEFLKRDKGETILGLRESLTGATDCLKGEDSSVAVSSGGELFLRFISLTSLEHQASDVSCSLFSQ
ncbi:Translation initiation factor [Xenotaenia resolanae]|uniref:Translation initiation factor n=1 Tax=Xenotaenia resolanae TaxID=208358 RepID=A0ABV0VTI4_9TELE